MKTNLVTVMLQFFSFTKDHLFPQQWPKSPAKCYCNLQGCGPFSVRIFIKMPSGSQSR